jgi:hypothetical protein
MMGKGGMNPMLMQQQMMMRNMQMMGKGPCPNLSPNLNPDLL